MSHVVTTALLAAAFVVASWSGAAAPRAAEPATPLTPAARDQLLARAADLSRLRSLLIAVDGRLVEEHYYHGASRDRPANLKSASKSIIATLVGIAIDAGFLSGVDALVARYLPSLFDDGLDPVTREITIEDLLTMRSGLETTSNRNYGRWVQSSHWVRHVLTRPVVARPGGPMVYSTGSSHLLSAIITEASGMSTLAFARRYLAEPLGIAIPAWLRDPQGVYFGGNEMVMTPRALLQIGQLYLGCGTFDGRRVVAEQWIHESWQPRTRSRYSGRQYGYGWWMRELGGHQTYYAWGFGGQFLFVVPELQLVAVVTSSPNPGDGRRQHLRAVYDLMDEQVIPVVSRTRRSAR